MSTLEEVNAAIATLQTIAQKLETAKLLLYGQQSNVQHLVTTIAPSIAEKAILQFHFAQ